MITVRGISVNPNLNIECKAVLAYGLNIDDANIEYQCDEDEIEQYIEQYIDCFDEIMDSDSLSTFAANRGISIKSWEVEDTYQPWIVIDDTYIETVHMQHPDISGIDTDIWDDLIIQVKNEILRLLEEKGHKASYDGEPCWGFQLYARSRSQSEEEYDDE